MAKRAKINSTSFFVGRGGNDGIISFGSGQPDLPPPKEVYEILPTYRAFKYGLIQGQENLRVALAGQYSGNPRTQRAEQSSYDGQVPAVKTAPKYDALILGIKPSREKLKSAIKARLQKRIRQGMIAEVKNLRARGVSWRRLEELGLEYKYAALYLQNKKSKEEMIKILGTKINQYAKRQMTWFKKTPGVHWIKNYREAVALIKDYDIP